jgi:transcriptional regulator with XRE-family HTH domain
MPQDKMEFPALVRSLRVEARLKQREVAEQIGIKTSTYGNVECNNHKTIRIEKVHAMARFYGLDPEAAGQLVAAWEALPVSAYNAAMAPARKRRDQFRAKAKLADALKLSLCELVAVLITNVDDPGALCTCPPPDLMSTEPPDTAPCELCNALQLLGMPGWTDSDQVIAGLAAAQEALAK